MGTYLSIINHNIIEWIQNYKWFWFVKFVVQEENKSGINYYSIIKFSTYWMTINSVLYMHNILNKNNYISFYDHW